MRTNTGSLSTFISSGTLRPLSIYPAVHRCALKPLLHLDAEHDLVQSIKLAEQIMGRGSERVRLPLSGARREQVVAMVEKAAATRPVLSGANA